MSLFDQKILEVANGSSSNEVCLVIDHLVDISWPVVAGFTTKIKLLFIFYSMVSPFLNICTQIGQNRLTNCLVDLSRP